MFQRGNWTTMIVLFLGYLCLFHLPKHSSLERGLKGVI